MFVLAALLLVAAAALILWVLFGLNGVPNNSIHFDGFGLQADLKPVTLFALGALALLLIWAATRLIAAGTKRKYRQHKETKALKKEHKLHEEQRVAAQNDRDALRSERDSEIERRETAEARQRVAERDVVRAENDRDALDANDRLGSHGTEARHYRD